MMEEPVEEQARKLVEELLEPVRRKLKRLERNAHRYRDKLAEENEQLRKALERFRDPNNWYLSDGGAPVWVGSPYPWKDAADAIEGTDRKEGA